jgi:tetratricopeptide (TPR) repeat protein
MKYLDFDLLIEASGDHYKARVLSSPAGQAAVDFSLAFSEQYIEIFLLKVGRPRRSVRRIDSPEMQAAKTFGGRLFETVLSGEVLSCFHASLNEASQKTAGLRLRLRLINAPDLADLPWEYLYNPSLNRFLSLSIETPIVRYLELPERIRPLVVKPPLKILVMISSPYDYPKIDVEQEWAKLREALRGLEREGLLTLERLEKATLSILQRRLRQKDYHIYHFIGHGRFDKQALDGELILEDENERGRPISSQYLGALLHDHRPLCLAILNTCEGARTSRSDPFAGTAQSLVQQGIPAVIAMQFEVTDEAAITFANEFYRALADGYPVDAALAEARKAIFAQGDNIEWGTPVLYMRSPDGRIFDITKLSDTERHGLKITFLIREAKTAIASEDWQSAIEKSNEVLALDLTHVEARTILRQLPQEQELARLYAQGMERYEARRWREALDCFLRVQEIRINFKNVNALVAAINEEIRQDRIAALLSVAKEAVVKEDWGIAVEKYQAVLDLEPTHAQAKAGKNQARQEQKLPDLYAQGQAHYKAGRWSQALESLHWVQSIRPHYKDADALVAAVESKIAEEEEARAPQLTEQVEHKDEKTVTTRPTKPHTPPSGRRRSKRRILIASALAFTLFLIVLVVFWAVEFFKIFPSHTEKALFSIFTIPDTATVFLNKDPIGITPINDHPLEAGSISLRIEKRHYFTIDSMVVVEPGQDTSFAFSLKPAAWVTMQVNPPDAEVILDGASIELSKLADLTLSLGIHTISISRAGYKTLQTQFSVTQGDTILVYSLQAEEKQIDSKIAPATVGELQIASKPAGAEIFLNGHPKRNTPRTIRELAVGEYTIVLRKTGYEDYSATVTVTGRKVENVDASLIALKGRLRIQVKPFGSIYVDGELWKANTSAPYDTGLTIGPHRIKLESPGLGFLEKMVKVQTDKFQEVSIDFDKMVTLTVTAFDESGNPVRAGIYVDNQNTGNVTPKKLTLRVGRHTITVRHEGYTLVDREKIFDLEEDHEIPLKFTLKKTEQ